MRLVSGIQPSGQQTIGNYLGAIKQFVKLQDELKDTEFFIFIADLHSITVPFNKTELKKNIKSLAALYIACGLDPEKVTLFVQSEVPAHSQLSYIMETTVYIPELERMTQYKQKARAQKEGIRGALLTYPALMAADILLYDANIVPIGDDQKQHLELTRMLAERFNSLYGETFVVPKGVFPEAGARVMSLQDPTKKMSKSDENPKSSIYLLENINAAKNKIKSAITDSLAKIKYDKENQPGIANLLEIYSALTDRSIEDLVSEYKDSSYKDFKEDLANEVEKLLLPIQQKYNELISSKVLDEILNNGQEKANQIARRQISKVYRRLGLNRK